MEMKLGLTEGWEMGWVGVSGVVEWDREGIVGNEMAVFGGLCGVVEYNKGFRSLSPVIRQCTTYLPQSLSKDIYLVFLSQTQNSSLNTQMKYPNTT